MNWKKTFAFIWVGQLFSTLTSSVVSFAIIFWLSIQTGSAEVLAYSTLASMMPQLVLGLFSGVLVDRWNRKKVMILADLYIAALTSVMAVLFYTGNTNLGFIYTLLALRSIGSAFHTPAMEASVPLLAPQDKLMRIAGINNMIFSVSTIAAPAVAAIFIGLLDMTWVLMLDVMGALIACCSLFFVSIPNPTHVIDKQTSGPNYEPNQAPEQALYQEAGHEPTYESGHEPFHERNFDPTNESSLNPGHEPIHERNFDPTYEAGHEPEYKHHKLHSNNYAINASNTTSIFAHITVNETLAETKLSAEFRRFLAEFRHGIREVQMRPGIMWMFIFTVFASLAMVPVSTLFPLMTLEHFAGDTYMMSLIEIVWGVGMLIGGGIMSLPGFKFNKVVLINTMYIILGIAYLFSGFLPPEGFYVFAALSMIGGIAGAIFWGAFTVLLQTSIDPGVLGRVFSIHGSLIMIPAMFSLVATGYIADTIGISNTFIIGGIMLILIGLISPLIPSVRKLSS